jgi:hypothetical protein
MGKLDIYNSIYSSCTMLSKNANALYTMACFHEVGVSPASP